MDSTQSRHLCVGILRRSYSVPWCDRATALFDRVRNALHILGGQSLRATRFQEAGQRLAAEDFHIAVPGLFDKPTGQCKHRQREDRRADCAGQPLGQPGGLSLGLFQRLLRCPGQGKQGGAGVIYFIARNSTILLLVVYKKAKFDNLPTSFLAAPAA